MKAGGSTSFIFSFVFLLYQVKYQMIIYVALIQETYKLREGVRSFLHDHSSCHFYHLYIPSIYLLPPTA